MNSSMTFLAEQEASLVHLLLAETVQKALFSMNPSGDEMMLRESSLTTTQLAAPIALLLYSTFRH
jgi:hypothetical protein